MAKFSLSKRLSLVSLMAKNYLATADSFVDMCCDHGYLGLEVSRFFKKTIYFVDPVESIIEKLKNRAMQLNVQNAQFLAIEGQAFESNEGSPVISICGVGGDLIKDIIQNFLDKNPHSEPIFILAPQNRPVELRTYLVELGMKANEMDLVMDNNKFYEVFVVSKKFKNNLSLIGEPAFNLENQDHLFYLKKKREHYHFKSRKDSYFKDVVFLYDELLSKLK